MATKEVIDKWVKDYLSNPNNNSDLVQEYNNPATLDERKADILQMLQMLAENELGDNQTQAQPEQPGYNPYIDQAEGWTTDDTHQEPAGNRQAQGRVQEVSGNGT